MDTFCDVYISVLFLNYKSDTIFINKPQIMRTTGSLVPAWATAACSISRFGYNAFPPPSMRSSVGNPAQRKEDASVFNSQPRETGRDTPIVVSDSSSDDDSLIDVGGTFENHSYSPGERPPTSSPYTVSSRESSLTPDTPILKVGSTSLNQADINRLEPKHWLNDNILNASLRLMASKHNTTTTRTKNANFHTVSARSVHFGGQNRGSVNPFSGIEATKTLEVVSTHQKRIDKVYEVIEIDVGSLDPKEFYLAAAVYRQKGNESAACMVQGFSVKDKSDVKVTLESKFTINCKSRREERYVSVFGHDNDIVALFYTDNEHLTMEPPPAEYYSAVRDDNDLATARRICEHILHLPASSQILDNDWVILNSYFWTNLSEKRDEKAYNHAKGLKNDTKFIFPLHLNNNHWALMIVDLNFDEITYYDSLAPPREEANHFMKTTEDFVAKYIDSDAQKPRRWQRTYENEPKQEDDFNCGVWVYMRARKLVEGTGFQNPDDARREIKDLLAKETLNPAIPDNIFEDGLSS